MSPNPRAGMIDFLKLLGGSLVGLFRSHAVCEAEMAFLRQQLLVLKRSAPARPRLRLIFVWLYRLFPSLLGAAVVFKPKTLVRWHRSGFRLYWRWKSRRWRVAEARDRYRAVHCRQVHAQASWRTLSGLARLPAQPHTPHRRH